MTLRYESTVRAGWVALLSLCCVEPGLVAVTPQNGLRRVLWVSGVRDGELAQQEP